MAPPYIKIAEMAKFSMFAVMTAKPEYRDKISDIMRSPEGVAVGKNANGNLHFDICQDSENPNIFRACELWNTKEDWEKFMQLRDESGGLVAVHGIDFAWLAEPPDFYPGVSLGVM